MGKSGDNSRKNSSGQSPQTPPPPSPKPAEPVNVVDGIPDRSKNPRVWKYLALAAIFVAWVALLLLLWRWGKP